MKNAITKRLQGNDIDANLFLMIVKASLERQGTHLRYNHKIGKKAKQGAKIPIFLGFLPGKFQFSNF